MRTDLIYAVRQALEQSQADVAPDIQARLRASRAKALLRAEKRFSRAAAPRPSRFGWALDARPAWGAGMALASVITVLVAVTAVYDNSIDQDITRIAEIDKQMISDRLPVQAYLDPGFLAFQEETVEEAQGLIQVASSTNLPMPSNRSASPLRRIWSAENFFPGSVGSSQGPAWAKLSTAQREALAPLEDMWGDLDEQRKRKWIKIADRFHQLDDEQQQLAQQRMQEWVSLGTTERRQARAIYGGVANLVPEDIRVMKWNEYQKLSDAERERLLEIAQQRIAEAGSAKSGAARQDAQSGVLTPNPHSALATRAEKPLGAR